MSRKNNLNFHPINAQSIGANFNTFATPTNVDYMDNIGLVLKWTIAGTPVGVFEVWVSNNPVTAKPSVSTDYTKLDFGSIITIDNSQTTHTININQIPFSWIAFKYTSASGTGTLDVYETAKMVGG